LKYWQLTACSQLTKSVLNSEVNLLLFLRSFLCHYVSAVCCLLPSVTSDLGYPQLYHVY
jgi:hypothetical protein